MHPDAKVGDNCRIYQDVTIGVAGGIPGKPTATAPPVIGNNVFIGAGAKIIGDIVIADDVCIAANAVVIESVLEAGITVGGIPAKKISNNGSKNRLIRATEIVKR